MPESLGYQLDVEDTLLIHLHVPGNFLELADRLLETSIEAVMANLLNPDVIVERNMKTLRELGMDGWKNMVFCPDTAMMHLPVER